MNTLMKGLNSDSLSYVFVVRIAALFVNALIQRNQKISHSENSNVSDEVKKVFLSRSLISELKISGLTQLVNSVDKCANRKYAYRVFELRIHI